MASLPDPTTPGRPLRWIYPIVGGIIAEALTIAFIALVVSLTGHAASSPGVPRDPVAQKIGALAGATVGSLMCFVLGWWAARRADDRFEEHGLLTGASAGFVMGLGAVFGPPGQGAYYLVALVLKVLAGGAGGRTAARMSAAGRGTTA